jgi:hypothetical protein
MSIISFTVRAANSTEQRIDSEIAPKSQEICHFLRNDGLIRSQDPPIEINP